LSACGVAVHLLARGVCEVRENDDREPGAERLRLVIFVGLLVVRVVDNRRVDAVHGSKAFVEAPQRIRRLLETASLQAAKTRKPRSN